MATAPEVVDPRDQPFNIGYDAVWAMVDASPMVKRLVRPGNMIRYNQLASTTPRKDEVSQADLPEIILVGTGCKGGIRITSNGCTSTLTLQWIIATGDPGIHRYLLPVMFALYAALANWPGVALGIPWRSGFPIKRVDLLEANLGLVDPERNRGIEGWSAVWSAEMELYFKTQDVLDFNNNIPYTGN